MSFKYFGCNAKSMNTLNVVLLYDPTLAEICLCRSAAGAKAFDEMTK